MNEQAMNKHSIDDLRICVKGCGYWVGEAHECHPHWIEASDVQAYWAKMRLRSELKGKGNPYWDKPLDSRKRRYYLKHHVPAVREAICRWCDRPFQAIGFKCRSATCSVNCQKLYRRKYNREQSRAYYLRISNKINEENTIA